MKNFLFTALATLALIAPANATIGGNGPTTERYIREMNACGVAAADQDFNKFRAKFNACLRTIEGWPAD